MMNLFRNRNRRQPETISLRDRISLLELQQEETKQNDKWSEIGSSGLRAYAGYITEAYTKKLEWPSCCDEYNRIWRSDPEIGIAKTVIQAFASRMSLSFTLPERDEQPSDDDKRACDFADQCLEDLEGGASAWISSCLSRVLFYGWGWWEAPPAMRDPNWKPPDDDPWRSNYDDGLIGFRRLAFRHYKSFSNWEMDESNRRVTGIVQIDPYGKIVTIPLDRSLHVKFGDLDNPEGLATMEAIWRMERVKYGLEVVFGIGAEHTAGHLSVTSEKGPLDDQAKAAIKAAARNIMSAHEGNYAAWPAGYKGELVDVPFQGGTVVLDAIRYWGILKLAILNMQWMALGTLSPYGSYSASEDASNFFVAWFNAVAAGIVKQADEQIGKRLFDYPVNKAAFPGMTRRPVLQVTPVQKDIKLADMGQFLTSVQTAGMALGDDDWLAVRRKTEFLPDTLPEVETIAEPAPNEIEGEEIEIEPEAEEAEMQAASSNGAMVAFFLEDAFAKKLAIQPGDVPEGSEAVAPEELHITLAFLGDSSRLNDDTRDRASKVLQDFAGKFAPLTGAIGGAGKFLKLTEGRNAFFAQPDVSGIQELRQELVKALLAVEVPVDMNHGFVPHITLAYLPEDSTMSVELPVEPFKLDRLALSWGLERDYFPMTGERIAELAFRPFAVPREEQTVDITPEAEIHDSDVDRAIKRFEKWARENAPEFAGLLDAKEEENGEE